MSSFQFFVNGDWVEFDDFELDWSLAHALRDRLWLTGTKIGCDVGGCGSCTVLISQYDKSSEKTVHYAVNACITPIFKLYGCHVLTIEGLGLSGEVINIQDALVRGHGMQCGFCTPGIVMSVLGFEAERKQKEGEMTVPDLKTSLQGNLCRCTGYRPILQALKECGKSCSSCPEPCSPDIEDTRACKTNNMPMLEDPRVVRSSGDKLRKIEKLLEEFSVTRAAKSLEFQLPIGSWFVPRNLKRLKSLMAEHHKAVVVGGCSSLKLQNIHNPSLHSPVSIIDPSEIEELRRVEVTEEGLRIGAGLTIAAMDRAIDDTVKVLQPFQTTILKCLKRCVHSYASPQIRNIATVGGNLHKYADYSDFQTFCEGFGVQVSYLKLSEDEDEVNQKIVSHITIPFSKENEDAWFEKVSKRVDSSTALINAAIKRVGDDETTFTFGGLTLKRFKLTLNKNTLDLGKVEALVVKNFVNNGSNNLPSMQLLAKNIVRKYLELPCHVEEQSCEAKQDFKATQLFEMVSQSTPTDLVHHPLPHASAYKQVTGEARFCDDVPKLQNELEMAFVLSTKAHAKIVKINFDKAMELEGVVGHVSCEDLSEDRNLFGLVERDEHVFARGKVTAVGQIIAAVVASHRKLARMAAKLVEVEYEEINPKILTIEDAIEHNSFYENHGMTLKKGDCEKSEELQEISSEVEIGSQEHFYLEPQSCIVIPKNEDGELEIISSTQNPTGVQFLVARCLNIPANRIVVRVKRVGGGFGGKETRCLILALPAAVAAKKFGRAVRVILDRTTDMRATGKRHFYKTKQSISFKPDGKLEGVKMAVYANAGNTLDVSMAPIERIMLNIDNAYNVPNFDLEGFVCKTNIPSNTVMRGTGAPQAAFLMENIMDAIASTLGKDPAEVREAQLYSEGDMTPYGQKLDNCNVRKCWTQCMSQSDYLEERTRIAEFNMKNNHKKRGISINPCHSGIGYTVVHLNQGAALIHVYVDGSVLISHGGVEIGQGVHSKMIQIATRELGISASKVRISETATDKVPNTTPSSASVTSDLQGMAVADACKQIIERLQPYWIKNPDALWEDLVNAAYEDRVSLSVTGFYKVPDIGWDVKTKTGIPWHYFSTGTACTIVELDCFTGRFEILKTDIVMDVGKSLNPGVDIGQIEGAFVHGIGLFTMEEVIIDKDGTLLTADPSTYKIPTASDVPHEFNVTLLSGSDNNRAVCGSKTVGEPPLMLATSVFFAVKDAIRSYRKSIDASPVFNMNSPATIETILLALNG